MKKRTKRLCVVLGFFWALVLLPLGQAVPVCDDLHPTETNDFYVDGASLCGPCSDANPGTVTQPWCTFERAFKTSLTPHLEGSGKLYIREGTYRFDSAAFGSELSLYLNLNGTADNPTVISGYPGEKPTIYFSDRVQGWERYAERPDENIWAMDWKSYLQANHNWQYLYPAVQGTRTQNIAQLVAIDEDPIILFQQINSLKNGWTGSSSPDAMFWADSRFPGGTTSIGTNQFDMDQGTTPTFYYENETTSPYFGKLFIWLPDGTNPNNRKVEVSVSQRMPFAFAGHPVDYLYLKNFTVRFAGALQGAITVSGSNNRFENLDSSYGGFAGLAGLCKKCVVKNSVFSFNGNTGAGLQGENTIIEGNIFEGNNWKKYSRGWHAGGVKFTQGNIESQGTTKNMVFRNNLVKNNFGWGIWFDFALMENTSIEGNMIVNNSFDGIRLEVSGGTAERPAKVRNNILINNGKGKFEDQLFFYGGMVLSGAYHTLIENNLIYDSPSGITENNVSIEYSILQQNVIRNNVFINVSFPLAIPPPHDPSSKDNTADKNLFMNPGPSFYWDNLIQYAATWEDQAEAALYIANWERLKKLVIFCYANYGCWDWAGASKNFTQWQELGFDQDSVLLPDEAIDLSLYGIDANQVGDSAQSIAAIRRDLWPAFEETSMACTVDSDCELGKACSESICLSPKAIFQRRMGSFYDEAKRAGSWTPALIEEMVTLLKEIIQSE